MIKRFCILFLILICAVSMIYATTEFVKVNDNEIRIIKTITKEEINVYPYEWLIEKKELLIKQKNKAIADFNIKIAEIDALLSECKTLGIAEKVIIVPEPIEIPITDSGEVITVK